MLPSQDEPVKNETESSVGGVSQYDVIIVGGGAAGVGVAIALTHAGVENFLLVDRMRLVHPSLLGLTRLASLPLHFRVIPLVC